MFRLSLYALISETGSKAKVECAFGLCRESGPEARRSASALDCRIVRRRCTSSFRLASPAQGEEGVYVVERSHGSDPQFVPDLVDDVVGDHVVGGREGLDAVLFQV